MMAKAHYKRGTRYKRALPKCCTPCASLRRNPRFVLLLQLSVSVVGVGSAAPSPAPHTTVAQLRAHMAGALMPAPSSRSCWAARPPASLSYAHTRMMPPPLTSRGVAGGRGMPSYEFAGSGLHGGLRRAGLGHAEALASMRWAEVRLL